MTLSVAYNFPSSQIAVGYFIGAAPALPQITGTPTVQDNAAITINGVNFSASGNRVFVGDTELTINTQSTTQIVTTAKVFSREYMLQPVDLYVFNASAVESNHLSRFIQPATGQRVFAVTQAFLGDPSTRLESAPDLTATDEIIIRNVLGTSVSAANVNIEGNGTTDVAADPSSNPQVTSYEYTVFDGDQRSSTWATATFAAETVQTTTPLVTGMTQAAAETAAIGANMTARVVASVYSQTIPAGIVIAQFPAANASVNLGTILELTLSLGKAPTLVPNLKDKDTVTAAADCLNAGVVLGVVRPYIDGANSALIVNQSIAAGTAVDPGTVIDVSLSSRSMLDVRNTDYASARLQIQAANLIVDDTNTIFVTSLTVPSSFVIDQSPKPNAVVSPLQLVVLTVSQGAPVTAHIRVTAFRTGYFDAQLRVKGDTFELTAPQQYSPYWMTLLDTPPAEWLPFLQVFSAYVDREVLEF